jgi:hypothetical protein
MNLISVCRKLTFLHTEMNQTLIIQLNGRAKTVKVLEEDMSYPFKW